MASLTKAFHAAAFQRRAKSATLHRGTRTICSASGARPARESVEFRPCIDLHKGKVKQIVGSSLKDLPSNDKPTNDEPETNFETEKSSAEFAELYMKDKLTGGHVIMLSADDETKKAAFDALQAYPGGLQVGGGIRTDNAAQYLEAGASHVIVTSYVFREGKLDRQRLKELVAEVGKDNLVLDLSCRKQDGVYKVVTDRWQVFSDFVLTKQSLAELAESADELLVHGVDVEGMKLGIDEELVALLGDISPLPVTYAGGARSLEDLERVRVAGRNMVDVTIGSALDLFGGSLPYADVVAWHQSNGR
uniref:1-(5-phosphoribosyl)-5-[(5-phosphoribosylamino)methylideneamino] imidazole-4-carboxamide isomerase HISN3, chloroplastic n=1 Tax=Pyramimonas obovata TaxID=1411642 RepID=A0A7S0WT45_9CHLO|mmetsp:Transcript_38950/g.84764  ORF Transcript_38950/g.84764 Transcript_38950/m.84764 type:complete len:305 (+) Transcript_38950:67-981(+)